MKINRKDGIYMTDMFIFASIKKDEEKKVIDEDLTFSKEEDAIKLQEAIMEKYPECDVDIHYGGQPIYYYYIALE